MSPVLGSPVVALAVFARVRAPFALLIEYTNKFVPPLAMAYRFEPLVTSIPLGARFDCMEAPTGEFGTLVSEPSALTA